MVEEQCLLKWKKPFSFLYTVSLYTNSGASSCFQTPVCSTCLKDKFNPWILWKISSVQAVQHSDEQLKL